MTGSSKRLDGWKAIAAFFGRDRTTVARWARERGLPVQHIPGGKQKSVFAFDDELLAWSTRNPELNPATPLAIHSTAGLPPARRFLPLLAAVAIVALIACLILFAGRSTGTSARSVDPAIMADYVTARDAWGRRTPEDIRFAIGLYEKIIQRAPDFAPARAGLAEAWLIYREYGSVSDARAFGVARIAAQKALELDPDLPSGHRAIGFIDYWWDNDPAGAVDHFKRALVLDAADAQTQFWFANILADLGEADAAESHYQRARLLSPGSQPIAVEHACAQWQAGKDAEALRLLTDLEKRYPADATISNCLSWLHMGRGDIRRFSSALARAAGIRNEAGLTRLSQELTAAVARDPKTAHRVLIADARREIAAGTRRMREVPAFYASAMRDRPELIALMQEASVMGERWHSLSITSRIAQQWRNDPEVGALLARLRVEPPKFEGL